MSAQTEWILVGRTQDLITELENNGFLKELSINDKKYVLTYHEGNFGALNNKCNHMGGPLSKGVLKDGCIQCPWHYWEFDHKTGEAKNNSYAPLASHGGTVPQVPLKIEGDSLFLNVSAETKRVQANYDTGPEKEPSLWREPKREPGKIRVLGISTTAMDKEHPRFSTSEHLLKSALSTVGTTAEVETKIIALSDLNFRHCEGFYSKSEKACTWPCSITKMDTKDEMAQIYEGLVHWADVVIIASPIRWGAASSLYYKMAERLNSVQNQITLKDRVLIKNKVVGLIITGGQDNVQSVAGQMLTFFTELGFTTAPFAFVGHSLGWSSEDMQRNMDYVKDNEYLHKNSVELVKRSIDLVKKLI